MVVDDCDFELLSKYKWRIHTNQDGYRSVVMQTPASRMIMDKVPDGMVIDHINGDSLDNRRENLRIVTTRENSHNSKRIRCGELPGVVWHKRDKKWQATIGINGKNKYLGSFTDKYEAYNAYVNAYLEVTNV